MHLVTSLQRRLLRCTASALTEALRSPPVTQISNQERMGSQRSCYTLFLLSFAVDSRDHLAAMGSASDNPGTYCKMHRTRETHCMLVADAVSNLGTGNWQLWLAIHLRLVDAR